MSLWKLEWLRLWRTKRWLALLASFVIFGFLGPIMARYLSEFAQSVGGGIKIVIPPPIPADGFTNYIKNALQIGLIVAIIVAAGALAVDAKTSLSIFYRTRVRSIYNLFMPRYIVVTFATVVSFILGALMAWYETAVLIGNVDATRAIIGMLYVSLYLAFAMAIVAVSATIARGTLGTIGLSLAIILVLPILGLLKPISKWLPSELAGSMDALLRNTASSTPSDYVLAVAVTICLIIALLGLTAFRLKKREIEA